VRRIANATTTTATASSKESARIVQFKLATANSNKKQRPKTLLHELKALQPVKPIEETKVVTENKEEEEEMQEEMDTVDLAIDHSMELLCITTEISSGPGSPKTLREALAHWTGCRLIANGHCQRNNELSQEKCLAEGTNVASM